MSDNSWLTSTVPLEWEIRAKDIRNKRDAEYANIFVEEDTNMRWVGDLGEICFNHWLKANGFTGFHWHLNNAAGQPDFTVNGRRIDVKTVKRKFAPKPYYTAQITARHKDHPIDVLFFMIYQHLQKTMWFLGGIDMPQYLAKARYYSAGERVHKDYVIREGHEIYNAEVTILTPPAAWLQLLKGTF
ncbi:MAG TPA: hypothetical protein VFS25_22100 [Chitinophaga sp.]|uniref:hypothetical protein n=1 Tax=Chitinophaga sp. TaxID=1869181 RepID=UPI002DB95AA6|nr:hypothetical protein [Chitinophaga sp.]HEU4555554.1 hypothetical protein [Chitinophaga sp.]